MDLKYFWSRVRRRTCYDLLIFNEIPIPGPKLEIYPQNTINFFFLRTPPTQIESIDIRGFKYFYELQVSKKWFLVCSI